MKILWALLAFAFTGTALAEQAVIARYGVAYTLTFHLYAADGTLVTGATDGGTDTTCGKDGSTGSTCTNDFAEIEGGLYKILLTAGEMQAGVVHVLINEAIDEAVLIETCGSPSAKWYQCPGGF